MNIQQYSYASSLCPQSREGYYKVGIKWYSQCKIQKGIMYKKTKTKLMLTEVLFESVSDHSHYSTIYYPGWTLSFGHGLVGSLESLTEKKRLFSNCYSNIQRERKSNKSHTVS